ncbi:sugar phosphate nucleotidyltransferase [Gorillibacterium massiliense]|uniref:sugar phosphate nucleotidyltransferase n=1 Tax=Gorillibacterium massiliense TaxID=1280390 RepID=UPI0004B45998|nr:sugar phosphate nucleotidyltransferase [Gorillibacterium massiliense]
MKLVLLSGGSGKRLWPLSNDSRSKQFLKVLNNEQGGLESMVQRVWGQITRAGLREHAYLATGRGQLDLIHSQIGADAPVVIEPERRDTFPAIALAAVYLYSVESVKLNETIAILPVDPYVADSFFQTVSSLDGVLNETGADLALIGVKPTYPSEKYGYIVPDVAAEGENALGALKVSHFAEKPNEQEARRLIGQNALWNCGVFAFKLSTIINLLIQRGLPIQYEELSKQYHKLPKISFDYEVVEKAEHIVSVPYHSYWKDLGTWNTLTEEIATPLIGKGMVSADSLNTHLINELDIPVAVLGLSNIVVSASPDGILVSCKEASPRVKDVVKEFDQRPMYEERRWGSYRVLDYKKFPDGQEVLTKRICIDAGKNLSYQFHTYRSEVWTVIQGKGEYVLNDRVGQLEAGDVIRVPVGTKHSIRALTDLEIIEVQSGTPLIEEDIHRFSMKWDEILQLCK